MNLAPSYDAQRGIRATLYIRQTLVRDDLLDDVPVTIDGYQTKMVTAPYSADKVCSHDYGKLEHFVRRNGERSEGIIGLWKYLIDAGLSDMSHILTYGGYEFVVESELNKHCPVMIGLGVFILECDRRSAGTPLWDEVTTLQFSTSVMAIPRFIMKRVNLKDIISVSNDKSSQRKYYVSLKPYVIDH
ncbi:hypothetical protein SPFM20_00226 [Salmonella phage SPFM20]|nr:hypothetical protein SPFM20_00226 [Salmonella phage SPFM20]